MPKGDPNSAILPSEMLSTTKDEIEANEAKNVELVSLVNSVDENFGDGEVTRLKCFWGISNTRPRAKKCEDGRERHAYSVQCKLRVSYDKDALKGRYTNLWKQFNDVKNLLGQSGFSWDEARQMARSAARSYKTKAVLNFSDLCVIYGYTTADGRYSRSSHDVGLMMKPKD
ncbi:hypothetical protein PTKIN_Ptkin19aG0135500 [Pterospermum kingtungense]